MATAATFTCAKFPIPIPAEISDRFCAKRHRKAVREDPCFDCEKGKEASKATAEQVRSRLPAVDKNIKIHAAKERWVLRKSGDAENTKKKGSRR